MNWPELDINLLRGLSLVLLIVAFVGMWIWAWSDKRKDTFKELSELPLEEDHGIIPGTDSDEKGSKE
jgi:cytochrome c oxidase cbb3-type subunit 4